ncbi:MAG: hypothetical protein G3M70_11985 [Candidatus Nitronauta litoralis]|uniref:Uncharacterized protein n=1 Tax=Candidatus Nitronauta litoralis TaxID=2705533 RepID=A0A7T0G163_9BACT|nr:MAG: hypothetical protein G3M70_11985 [Candidatus Nitronauta litoralis]
MRSEKFSIQNISRNSSFSKVLAILVLSFCGILLLFSPSIGALSNSGPNNIPSGAFHRLNQFPEENIVLAERTLVITLSTKDPCKEILKYLPAKAQGRKFTLKGVSLSGNSFFLAACQKMRADLEGAAQSRLKDISGYSAAEKQFNAGVESVKRDVYVYFLQFVALKIYDYLPPEEQAKFAPNSPAAMDKALEWLAKPENEIQTYVHAYLEAKAKPLARLFNDYMSGASMEIITGLQGLMKGAKDKFDRFTKMQQEIEAGDTNISDALEKYGFSGDYLRKFKEYEGRIKGLNEAYKIKDAVVIIAGAFQTDVPDQKIAGMMDLLSLVGGVAEDSNIPIVSLFGQIVKAYGDIGKEMLAKVLALEKMIRGREGFCIGGETHSMKDPKNKALIGTFGPEYEACPLELDGLFSNVFYQTEPKHNNNQLFFWDGKKFIKGNPGGGGSAGLNEVIRLIKEGERLNFASYAGKSNDIPTIAEVYNTPYPKDSPRGKNHSKKSGVVGLREEANLVINALGGQIKSLRRGADPYGEPSCTVEKVDRWIEKESGQQVERFMSLFEQSRRDLKTSYALAFVEQHNKLKSTGGRRTAAYKTYSRFFDKVEHLSLFKIRGWVLDEKQPGRSCPNCGGANIDLSFSNSRELPGCEINQADGKGRFIAHLVTKSSALSAKVSASVGNVRSETFPIEPDKLGFDLTERPFIESFSLTLPLKFEEDEQEENKDKEGPSEEGGSIADIAGQLEMVATQAETASSQLSQACQVLSGLGEVEADLNQFQSDFPKLKSEMNAVRQEIENHNQRVVEIQKMSSDASGISESIIDYKKTAESQALFACEQAELLQKKQGEPAKLVPRAEAAGRNAKSAAGKAGEAYTRVRTMASDAEAKAQALGGAADKLKSILQRAQEKAGALTSIENQLSRISEASVQAAEARKKLPELKARAESLFSQGRSVSGETDQLARLDAAFGRVVTATQQVTPCDEKAAAQLLALKDGLASAKANHQVLQPQLESLSRRVSGSDGSSLKESVARIKAVADTGEVFSEAAQQSGADAMKCVALARSMVREGPDKLVGTARVAIAACEFKNAKGLIKTLGSDPRRAKLEALYFERVRYEGKTKTLFAQANQLFKDNQLEQALALLKEARGHTKCDKFRGRIEQAIGKIEAGMQAQQEDQKPDQQQANVTCQSKKSGSIAVEDPTTRQYDCRCPSDRVESPDGKSCIDKSTLAGQDTDLEPEEPETFAVAFKIYFLQPNSKPKTLEIPKGADSKTRKRIKKQNEIIIEKFAKNLSFSNTSPKAITKMKVPMMIGIAPGGQEAYPLESFAPGDKYSIPVTGNMPGKSGSSKQNVAFLLEVIRSYESFDELKAAYPEMDTPGQKGPVNSKNISQAVIKDSSGTFTINNADSGQVVVGPLTKGWTTANKQRALNLSRQIVLMSGSITCFVATAVYEDPLADQITVLRSFRDNTLLASESGTRLVRLYYKYGPGWALWVKEHPSVSEPLRIMFDAGVSWLKDNDLKNTWQGDLVDGVVRVLDTISTWFTDEGDYSSPASSSGLLNWLGI